MAKRHIRTLLKLQLRKDAHIFKVYLKTFYVTKNNIKKAGNKIHSPANTSNSGGLASRGVSSSATNNIPQNAEKSNTNKSLDVDTDGNTLTEAQQKMLIT